MNDIWEETWKTVSETFRQMAASLRARDSKIAWSFGHSDNQAFPFRAYAAFNLRFLGSEDVVVSVDFHRSEDKLRYNADKLHYSVDISRDDDGLIFADGPTGIIDVSAGVGSARNEIEAAVGSMVRFLKESEQVVWDAINQQ